MTIALESEVVATRYDFQTRTCFYTIERDGRRWTVPVLLEHLEAHGNNNTQRREHLAKSLLNHMNSKAPDTQ